MASDPLAKSSLCARSFPSSTGTAILLRYQSLLHVEFNVPSAIARMPASSLTEEICDKAPLTDVVKGDMASQSGENSSILSSKVSCLGGDPMSMSLFSNNRSGSLERRSHDCRHPNCY